MPIIEGARRLKVAKGEYDFAVDGGAISQITLRSAPDVLGIQDELGNSIPTGSIILGGYIEVDTLLTSGGGATVSADSEAAGDLLAAAAISGAPWSTTGRKNILPALTSGAGTAATIVKTTAARSLKVTIATATLTAGKFRVVIVYI